MARKRQSAVDPPADSETMGRADSAGEDRPLALELNEGWESLFDGESALVQLIRIYPDEFAGQKVAGYLETLPQGLPDYPAYIKKRYGGGTFRVCVRNSAGKFQTNRTIDIPGQPRVEPVAQAESDPDSGDLSVSGIPLAGSDDRFMRMLERAAIIKRIMSEPEQPRPADINATLLQHLLTERQQPNPLDQVGKLTETLAALRELLPESGGGEGFGLSGIVKEALPLLRQALVAGQAGGQSSAVPRLSSGNYAAITNQSTEAQADENGEQTMAEPNPKEVAAAAVELVTANFLEGREASTVVQQLDTILPSGPAITDGVKKNRSYLWVMAQAALTSAGGGDEKQFKTYFDKVFDAWTDGKRSKLEWQE